MKKLLIVLFIIGLIYMWSWPHGEYKPPEPSKECQSKEIDYKQAYKQAIDKYKHLTIEELDYAIALAFQQPRHIPIPKDLHAAYQHRHKQKYEQEIKEIKRLSQLSNEEFIRQAK